MKEANSEPTVWVENDGTNGLRNERSGGRELVEKSDSGPNQARGRSRKKTTARPPRALPKDRDYDIKQLRRALALPNETEWVEFKLNRAEPEEIGEYISALANSAALQGESEGFMIWGVEDGTHQIVGTVFRPREEKVSGQELESWLTNYLSPRIDLRFVEFENEGKYVVMLIIPCAMHTPVRFRDNEFIRVGSYKKKLKDYPEKERSLWTRFGNYRFEDGVALPELLGSKVLSLLDYSAYYRLIGQSQPANPSAILDQFVAENMIAGASDGSYDILNLGAILFANDLTAFGRLLRKILRIIIYEGKNRVKTVQEYSPTKGYAVSFEDSITFIKSRLPTNEQIGEALCQEVRMYPDIAVRELVANALIHQDFSITGAGPTVEISDDRVEITNPGIPLIDTARFLDLPPRSRNEPLASFMRRINMCEERGSGIDKVILSIELYQLPAPDFRVVHDNTVSVLYGQRPFSQMDRRDRIRACYQHAGLRFVSNERMTNTSLRKRFAIEEKNYSIASRIIGMTLEEKLIKPLDPESTSRKHASYVPFWA